MLAILHVVDLWRPYLLGKRFQIKTDHHVENTKTTERGGGESVVIVLKQYMTIQTIFNLFQVTINIIQYMNNMNNEHQSHIRYT